LPLGGHAAPWGILAHVTLPLAALSLGVGQWDSTSAAAALLLTPCMTDIIFDGQYDFISCQIVKNPNSTNNSIELNLRLDYILTP
jgi:hypothetical protein